LHEIFAGLQSAHDQFNSWHEAVVGYLIQYGNPKRIVFRDLAKRSLTHAGSGFVGEKAATAIADYVVLDMFASFCSGREGANGAIKIAERQLQRVYR
jgi:multiple sugar transport system substrate-binding protein